MIADVSSDVKARPIIGGFQGGDHFKQVMDRLRAARHHAADPFDAGEFAKHLSHVIRHGAALDARPMQDPRNGHVEVKMVRDPQTAGVLGVTFVRSSYHRALKRAEASCDLSAPAWQRSSN
jgi:hypothetical protein